MLFRLTLCALSVILSAIFSTSQFKPGYSRQCEQESIRSNHEKTITFNVLIKRNRLCR